MNLSCLTTTVQIRELQRRRDEGEGWEGKLITLRLSASLPPLQLGTSKEISI